MQEEVDDILPQLNRDGPKCVLYNLSFAAKLFDKWGSKDDTTRAESLRYVTISPRHSVEEQCSWLF